MSDISPATLNAAVSRQTAGEGQAAGQGSIVDMAIGE